MTETPDREIVATRLANVNGHQHVVRVKLRDGAEEDVEDVMAAIKAHDAHYVMLPVQGTPAYEAHVRSGNRQLVQVRPCPTCRRDILWA